MLTLAPRLLLAATHLAATSALILAAGGAAQAVDIEWVTVGDPGNAADTEVMTCCDLCINTTGYGSVDYVYQISKYEITNAQYAEFLNTVAATDPVGLYNPYMAWGPPYYGSGITRSGSSGSYTYSVVAGREDMPVNWVSALDAVRFTNWLHNGQPTGTLGSTTTEDGAYTISSDPLVGPRNEGATIVLPTEDEWYKAAYYDTALGIYYDYPAGSDTQTTCALPGATANTANCGNPVPAVNDLTDVGSYTGSASPNGTFDQGGNVFEWNELVDPSSCGLRAGSLFSQPSDLAVWSSYRVASWSFEEATVGIRVARLVSASPVPSLSPAGIALLGGLVFAIAVSGFAVQRRRRAG
jgi:formylglycine-generating enzyme required for sulfatase activity